MYDIKKIQTNIPLIVGCSVGGIVLYYIYNEIENSKKEVNNLKKEILNLKSYIKYQMKDETNSEGLLGYSEKENKKRSTSRELEAENERESDSESESCSDNESGSESDSDSDSDSEVDENEEEIKNRTNGIEILSFSTAAPIPTNTTSTKKQDSKPKIYELSEEQQNELGVGSQSGENKCPSIIRSGPRKGQECSRVIKNGDFCSLHS